MEEKLSLLKELIKLARCDQQVREQEYEFNHLKDIGIRMGLSPHSTNLVFTEMYKYPNKVIPPDKSIEIFKDQFN